MSLLDPQRVIISRTDSIGDVVLTLPMAGWIKKRYPNATIIFLGRNYTVPVIRCSKFVDQVVSWDDYPTEESRVAFLKSTQAEIIFCVFPEKEVVKAALASKIPYRVATGRRMHTLLRCNKRLWWTRKKSNLHESQLNLKMLQVLGQKQVPSLDSIASLYGFDNIPKLPTEFQQRLSTEKINVVLHPKSKGSAVEWSLDNFSTLIKTLPTNRVEIFITGTASERELIGEKLPWAQVNVVDLTGKMTLEELIAFLDQVDVVVAGSTGPIHIASALGTKTIGLYSPMRPIHPGRWQPLGDQASFMVADHHPQEGCLAISPAAVKDEILKEG